MMNNMIANKNLQLVSSLVEDELTQCQHLKSKISLALAQLTSIEQQELLFNLQRFNQALTRAGLQSEYQIRLLTPADDEKMADIIRVVSAEYGLSEAKGYGVADLSKITLTDVYLSDKACYWVICSHGKVLGGGGIAPLSGSDDGKICELQKMYFLPELRGKGLAKRLTIQALNFARSQGYCQCYLETTACLKEAIDLYLSVGFEHIPASMGNTGHDACELPMLINL